MKTKRGNTALVIGIILFLISTYVLFTFAKTLKPGQSADRDSCHYSVITRGTADIAKAVPLKCNREDICLTSDGSCEDMTAPIKYKVKTKNETYKAIADNLANCWWMYGEGKVNYANKEMTDKGDELYCGICTQIGFDNSLDSLFRYQDAGFGGSTSRIDKRALYNYMGETKMPNKEITYWEYLYGDLKPTQPEEDAKIYFDKTNLADKTEKLPLNLEMNLDNRYYVVTGITGEVWFTKERITDAADAIIGSAHYPLTIGLAIAGGWVHMIGTFVPSEDEKQIQLVPTIVNANSDDFSSLSCKSIASTA